MNKVTTINLNGKAYQLEEKGYQALHTYLERAGDSLAENPDKKEILTDLEQAIADKCERFLQGKKDVIDAEEVTTILSEMGPVQTDDTETKTSGSSQPKRLYIIPKGGMIMGVCNGLAAYLGVDVTIIRVIFVVLAFATGGFWILVYLLLGFLLPYAKNEAQLAEAYGRRVTAQEIVDNAKDRAKDLEPALTNVGNAIGKMVRIAFGITAVILAIMLGLATTAWLSVLWWLAFGNLHLTAQLSTLSPWLMAAAASALYFLVAIPLFATSRACQRVARQQELSPLGRNLNRFGFGLWFAALAVIIVAASSGFDRVRDYVNTNHGYLDVGNHHVCVDRPICHPDTHRKDNPMFMPDGMPEVPPTPQLIQ